MSEASNGPAPMAKAYQPAEVEPTVYQRWLEADVFAPDGAGSRAKATTEPFTIIMPPPNVTGALHLGQPAPGSVQLGGGDGLGAVDLTVNLDPCPGWPNATPYNYSDMTGVTRLTVTEPTGHWTETVDAGRPGAHDGEGE